MDIEQDLLEEIVFIVLNVVFFGIFFLFVVNSSSGAFVLEQLYAKQIALLIDNSEPGTIIKVDISDAYEIAKENNVPKEQMFRFDKNLISVRLDSDAYRFGFFRDLSVITGVESDGDKTLLVMDIKDGENE